MTDLPSIDDLLQPATRFFCIGMNYRDHIAEMGREPTDEHPTVFTRFASSFVAPGEALEVPAASHRFDYEGELAVVIGTGGRAIAREAAMEHVGGYTVLQDGSIRDFQRHTTQFIPGKNFDRSGSIGPVVVPASDVGDPADGWRLQTRVGDEILQDSTTDQLIFDVPTLIAYLSTFTELVPGDVIATGTPSGVGAGRSPRRWLQPGETVDVEIEGIGILSNPVIVQS